MSADLNRGERLQIMLTEEELTAVDNWRFERRMPSRAAAVRELLRRGLAAEGFLTAESGKHSRSFGVVDDGAPDTGLPAKLQFDGNGAAAKADGKGRR